MTKKTEHMTTTATTKKKAARRWTPRPLLLPADEVSYAPADHWPEQVKEYLIAYARTGNRSAACRLIGRSTKWAYKQAAEYGEAFTAEENEAYGTIVDRIESTMTSRALEEPGMPGVTSGIFLLKAADPERFGERQRLEHSGRVETGWLTMMMNADKEADDGDGDGTK